MTFMNFLNFIMLFLLYSFFLDVVTRDMKCLFPLLTHVHKVRQGNLERGVTWNKYFPSAYSRTGAAGDTL